MSDLVDILVECGFRELADAVLLDTAFRKLFDNRCDDLVAQAD